MATLKIIVRSSATEERIVEVPIPGSRPLGGCTEVREFLAMRARQRRIGARNRRLKLVGLALGAASLTAALAVPRLRESTLSRLASQVPGTFQSLHSATSREDLELLRHLIPGARHLPEPPLRHLTPGARHLPEPPLRHLIPGARHLFGRGGGDGIRTRDGRGRDL